MSDTEAPTIEPTLSQLAREQFGSEYRGEVTEPEAPSVAEEATSLDDVELTPDEPDTTIDTKESEAEEVPISSLQELIESNEWDPEWAYSLQVTQKVDGEERKVSIKDLLATNQTMEAATKRLEESKEKAKAQNQALAEKQSELEGHFQMAAELIGYSENLLKQEIADVDWKTLETQDPADAALKRLKFQDRIANIENLKRAALEKYQLSTKKTREEADVQRQEILQRESEKLLQIFPDWKDPQKRDVGRTKIVNYLLSQGVPKEEIGALSDHRTVHLAYKAMLYDEGMVKTDAAKKKIVTVQKALKPGTPKPQDQINRERHQSKMDRLKKTGKMEDLLALLG